MLLYIRRRFKTINLLEPIFKRPVFCIKIVSQVKFPCMIGSSRECK